ncbi:hypothetical protein ACLIJR_14280 [Hydrogenophaga sp. XSHU_21]
MAQFHPIPSPRPMLSAVNTRCARALGCLLLGASAGFGAQAAEWSGVDRSLLWPAARSTSLIGVQQGSDLSSRVRSLKGQGFETSGGDRVDFAPWYSTNWTDLRITWMTQLSSHTGLIWGVGTGERGVKYRISPSLKLGLIHQAHLGRHTTLTLRATTTLGGRLRERPCTADYGAIGGVQAVNCRLAASELEPTETLRYLFNDTARDQRQVSVLFSRAF